MTLIIGCRAKDGVVVGADRKMLRGMEVDYSDKYYLLMDSVIFVAEGLTGIVDDFYYILRSELNRRRGVETLYELKVIAEDIIAELTERYSERIGDRAPARVILAGLENLFEGKANLYYIHSEGYGEHVKMICTGHGGPYALSLVKFLLDPEIGVEENAKRIAYVISWVSEEVDASVGGGPDVLYIKDRKTPAQGEKIVEKLSEDVIEEIKNLVKRHRNNLPQILELENKQQK